MSANPSPLDQPEEKPEFIEAVVGYRSWRLIKGELYPVTIYHAGGAWTPGENHAQCYKVGSGLGPGGGANWVPDPRHPAPHKDCGCGFYGTYERERAPDYSASYSGAPYINVYGIAAFWGEVCACPRGTRAEYAQVLALEVPKSDDVDLRPVAKRYGVPIRTREQLERWVRENVTPLPESVIPEPYASPIRYYMLGGVQMPPPKKTPPPPLPGIVSSFLWRARGK